MTFSRPPGQDPDSASISQSLLRRVKENDAQAWQTMVELYTPLICHWCRRANLEQDDIEEVCQETFRAVHAGIANFRHDRRGDTFRGWLRTIVRSRIANLIQQKNRTPGAAGGSEAMRWLEQVPESIDDDESTVVNALYQRAMQLIEQKFEPRTWQAFLLVTIEGLSSEEAGERLGMSPGAIRNARYKVLRELRIQVGELE